MVDEYHCLTLVSRAGESEAEFKARLSGLWTHMLRQHEETFKRVYAEMSAFEKKSERLGRKYLIEATVAAQLETQLRLQGMEFDPIDEDEVYSRYEATPPEWFWIEH